MDNNSDQMLSNLKNAVVALGTIAKALNTALPVVQSTAGAATAGAATLPANPVGFLAITLPNGTAARVPYYSV